MFRSMRAVTLVECLVAVAVLAVCLALALPSWRSALQAQRVRAAVDALADALRQARLEAMRRGAAAWLCPGGEAASRAAAAVAGGGCRHPGRWEQGWVLLGDPVAGGGDARVLAVGPPLAGVRVDGDAALAPGAGFDAAGWPRRPGGALLMGRLRVCPRIGGAGRELVLSAAGRLRVQALDCSGRAGAPGLSAG